MRDRTRHDPPTAPAAHQGRAEQDLIDAEVRVSRRALLAQFRARLRVLPQTSTADEFLQVADRPVVLTAILIAAANVADACVLHTVDPNNRTLRIARHRGLPRTFVEHFASVDVSTASTCAAALRTGKPVMVDDITTSGIYTNEPTLRLMLDAGSRAVHSYPLHADRLLGVLCLHHRTAGRHPRRPDLAEAAARALAHVSARPAERDRMSRTPSLTRITTTRITEDVVTLAVRGSLDALTAPDCTARLHETIAGLADGQALIIDLDEMDFLAVAGARVLAMAARLCASRGVHNYVLINPDHDAVRVLDTLGFTPRLRLITDAAAVLTGRRP